MSINPSCLRCISDAETAQGERLPHTCAQPQPATARDRREGGGEAGAALPVEVEQALCFLETPPNTERVAAEMIYAAHTIRTHLVTLTAERDALLKSVEHLSSDVIPDRAFVVGQPCLVCGDLLTAFATCEGNPEHTTGLTWEAFRRVHASRIEQEDKRDARVCELVAERDALRTENAQLTAERDALRAECGKLTILLKNAREDFHDCEVRYLAALGDKDRARLRADQEGEG